MQLNNNQVFEYSNFQYLHDLVGDEGDFMQIVHALSQKNDFKSLSHAADFLSDKLLMSNGNTFEKLVDAAYGNQNLKSDTPHDEYRSIYSKKLFHFWTEEHPRNPRIPEVCKLLATTINSGDSETALKFVNAMMDRKYENTEVRPAVIDTIAKCGSAKSCKEMLPKLLDGSLGSLSDNERGVLLLRHVILTYEDKNLNWDAEFINTIASKNPKITSSEIKYHDEIYMQQGLESALKSFCHPFLDLFDEYVFKAKLTDSQDNQVSPLHYSIEDVAAFSRKDDVKRLRKIEKFLSKMKDRGVKMNEIDQQGYTPLARIFVRKREEPSAPLLQVLFNSGMDPSHVLHTNDRHAGKNIVQLAEKLAHIENLDFLRAQLAKNSIIRNSRRPRFNP